MLRRLLGTALVAGALACMPGRIANDGAPRHEPPIAALARAAIEANLASGVEHAFVRIASTGENRDISIDASRYSVGYRAQDVRELTRGDREAIIAHAHERFMGEPLRILLENTSAYLGVPLDAILHHESAWREFLAQTPSPDDVGDLINLSAFLYEREPDTSVRAIVANDGPISIIEYTPAPSLDATLRALARSRANPRPWPDDTLASERALRAYGSIVSLGYDQLAYAYLRDVALRGAAPDAAAFRALVNERSPDVRLRVVVP